MRITENKDEKGKKMNNEEFKNLVDKKQQEAVQKWSEMVDAEFEKKLTEMFMGASREKIDEHLKKTSKIPKLIEDFLEKQRQEEIRKGIKVYFDTDNHIANIEIDPKLAQKIQDGVL